MCVCVWSVLGAVEFTVLYSLLTRKSFLWATHNTNRDKAARKEDSPWKTLTHRVSLTIIRTLSRKRHIPRKHTHTHAQKQQISPKTWGPLPLSDSLMKMMFFFYLELVKAHRLFHFSPTLTPLPHLPSVHRGEGKYRGTDEDASLFVCVCGWCFFRIKHSVTKRKYKHTPRDQMVRISRARLTVLKSQHT